jgi:primosomal protein N' (replication factor Y)
MYIVTVIPIQKGFQRENLTYFSPTGIPLGSIVSIPLRSKTADAIVIDVENARDLKYDLKKADFQLKKILNVKGSSPFSHAFFVACEKMKDYTVSNTGVIIKALLPAVFLENVKDLKKVKIISEETKENESENVKQDKLIFQALTPDRMSWYRTLIREAFAKKQSVYICVPTRYDIEQLKNELTKGISQYVFSFHGDLGKKNLINTYNSCINEPHPILIIGTGMFLSIPRPDVKTIIIEHENSDAYKQFNRPFIDIRTFAEILSSVEKVKLIFGDTLLRPDTLHRHEVGDLGEVASPLFRLPQAERQMVIDMKEQVDEKGSKTFMVLSDTTKKMISYALEHNESVLLFTIRKGLAGVTVCHDCGHTLLCPTCSTPVVLYGSKQRNATKIVSSRIFMCNKCGYKDTTEVRCGECQSWNLTPLGIGTDRVYEEVKGLYPNSKIIQMDKETVPTDKEARMAMVEFYKSPGSILIGTEMVFSYINTEVTHSAIISLDGLLSIPSFNITQKILHIMEKLHEITKRNLIIQTRTPENPILEHILNGNVLPLYREDLKERKQFGYPPFKRLIKITFTGSAPDTEKARSFIDRYLGGYEPQIFSAFIGKVKGQYVTNTVIKIDPTLWPIPIDDKKNISTHLSENLNRLPPSFAINVDPEDLL